MLQYATYIGLGILPALIWLTFYLHEDAHPEPKAMIFQVFLLGMAIVPVVLQVEILYDKFLSRFFPFLVANQQVSLISIFAGIAIIEEFFKFLVVKIRVFYDRNFDEPVDAMVYMIVSALGFAALENIIYLFRPGNEALLDGLNTALVRFVSATLLHALASGFVGYGIARSFFSTKKAPLLIVLGFFVAIMSHFLYNYLMSRVDAVFIQAVGIMLLAMAMGLTKCFDDLRKRVRLQNEIQFKPIN